MTSIPTEFLNKDPNSYLAEGEDKDLRAEVLKTLGKEWLMAKNVWLDNRAPIELIGTRDEIIVRDLLRSFKAASLS
jgi:hypothetical protein